MFKKPVVRIGAVIVLAAVLLLTYNVLSASAYTGTVEEISETQITIDGQVYRVGDRVNIQTDFQVGDVVEFSFETAADGTQVVTEIQLVDSVARETPVGDEDDDIDDYDDDIYDDDMEDGDNDDMYDDDYDDDYDDSHNDASNDDYNDDEYDDDHDDDEDDDDDHEYDDYEDDDEYDDEDDD